MGSEYDALYHTYSYYMMVRTKLQFGIFSKAKTPKVLFRDYVDSLTILKNNMQSDYDDRKHLETEIAFCYVKQIEKNHQLLD